MKKNIRIASMLIACCMLLCCCKLRPADTDADNTVGNINSETVNSEALSDIDMVETIIPDVCLSSGKMQMGDIVGNPIVLKDTDNYQFENFLVPNANDDTKIVCCSKNIFRLNPEMLSYSSNNVDYAFSPVDGTVSVTAQRPKKDSFGAPDKVELNGAVLDGVMGTFKFAENTLVTVSANCDDYYDYRSLIFFQILDGINAVQRDFGEGVTFIAQANVEYGIRIKVRSGTVCKNLVFKPQVEIGGCKTEFEPFRGQVIKYGDSNRNLIALNSQVPQEFYADNSVKCIFNSDKGIVNISADRPLEDAIVYDSSSNMSLNGKKEKFLDKFSFQNDTYVFLPGTDISNKVFIQATDGTELYTDEGSGIGFLAKAEKEYGIRILVKKNAKFNSVSVIPKISSGIYALQCRKNITTVFTYDDTVIKARLADVNIVTEPKADKPKPMITFIDDDTSNPEYVKIFHDIFEPLGVTADYAVVTSKLDANDELAQRLLDYEKQGFGMLYHCDYQSGNKTLYWKDGSKRNLKLAEENFAAGLEKMEQYGFSDYKYWVSPYGVYDKDMQDMAKRYGLECLISYNKNSFISTGGNCNRFNIPRYAVSVTGDNNIPHIKDAINACCLEGGWLIVTTHVNEWGGQFDEMSDKVSDLVQYAMNSGMEVVSFSEGYKEFGEYLID